MKRMSKMAVLLLVFTTMMLATVACNKPNQILIEADNQPQLIFVQGQDLDLSGGKLTIRYDEEAEVINLDSKDVKVSGYDNNKIGEQVLTISYKKVVTNLTITVVPRISATGVTKNYFIGEDFDKQGDIIVTYNNGVAYKVPISDSKVTVSGFDSSNEATPLTVKVSYADEEQDLNYTGNFEVNINAIDTITFTRPSKTTFRNYETLDLGGYLTLKAKPEITDAKPKHVSLTEDMVSGFDTSLVTPEHRTEPLVQTVTVSYAGKEWNYTVEIKFSNVSLIMQTIEELGELDWTGEEPPEISEELGEKALDALEMYLGLETSEKQLSNGTSRFSITQKARLARTAAIYGFFSWMDEFVSFQDTFEIKEGVIYIMAEDPVKTKADFLKLQDPESKFNKLTYLLTSMPEEFLTFTLPQGTVGDVVSSIYDTTNEENKFDEFLGVLELMVTVYDTLKDIPADWTAEDLNDYATEIDVAHEAIVSNTNIVFVDDNKDRHNSRFVFDIISSWREDIFDIIYMHYYLQEDIEKLDEIKYYYLPNVIEEIFTSLENARITIGRNDRSLFIMYFQNTLKLEEELLQSENFLYIYLYQGLSFTGFVQSGGQPLEVNLNYAISVFEKNYIIAAKQLLGINEFHRYWDSYIKMIERNIEDVDYTFGNADFTQDVEALFAEFVKMSPCYQYGFLSSLIGNYPQTGAFFVTQEGYASFYSLFIIEHYSRVLSIDALNVFYMLINAQEYYLVAVRWEDPSLFNDFTELINQAKERYNKLESEEKALFDEKLGFFYTKITELESKYSDRENITPTDLGEWEGVFTELESLLEQVISIREAMVKGEHNYRIAYLAAYEAANALVEDILAKAPEEVVNAFYHEPLFQNTVTLELAWFEYRGLYSPNPDPSKDAPNFTYIDILYRYGFTANGQSTNLLKHYTDDMGNFLAKAYYTISTGVEYDDELEKNFTDEQSVLDAMSTFRSLDKTEKIITLLIVDEFNLYHQGVSLFFEEVLTEGNVLDLGNELLDFEAAFIVFVNLSPESTEYEEALVNLNASMDEISRLEGELTEDDQADFDQYLKAMYDYYVEQYNNLDLDGEN